MRKGISITVTPADRVRLQSIIRDRNSPQKHVWRARIIVLSADSNGTIAIARAVGKGKTVGISPSSVRRMWKEHGLQPHRVRAFKISNDPKVADKLKEVVGLYVDPPDHAVVLSIDEKSQIQALDRTQPGRR